MPSLIQYERLVIGYHGCDRDMGERVLLTGTGLTPSDNHWDWLGAGVYFWEHGPARAHQWAEDAERRKKVKDPFVLGAFIHLGRCFDLTDTAAIAEVARWHEDLLAMITGVGQALPTNDPLHSEDDDLILRHLDCAVLNFGLSNIEKLASGRAFQTVRGVFTEGGPAFPGSGIQSKTHVQVAVRDTDCILGYFRPAQ